MPKPTNNKKQKHKENSEKALEREVDGRHNRAIKLFKNGKYTRGESFLGVKNAQ